MGKGCSNFRVTQVNPVNQAPQSDEQVKHTKPYKSFQLPEYDLEVRCAIKNWILKARKRFNLSASALPMPKLSYDLKGNTLGTANSHTWVITLNPVYLEHSPREQIDDTIPHEVCHLVTDKIYGIVGIRPHGREWQNVCLDLGHYPSVKCYRVPSFKDAEKQIVQKQINTLSIEDF